MIFFILTEFTKGNCVILSILEIKMFQGYQYNKIKTVCSKGNFMLRLHNVHVYDIFNSLTQHNKNIHNCTMYLSKLMNNWKTYYGNGIGC